MGLIIAIINTNSQSLKTVKFIRIFNNLFDVLNLRSIKKYGFKQAVSKEKAFEILQFAEETREYVLNQKIGEKQEMACTSKKKLVF